MAYEEERKEFGAEIKRLRPARGLNQVELAEIIDVAPNLVSQWEHGKTVPSARYYISLQRILGLKMLPPKSKMKVSADGE